MTSAAIQDYIDTYIRPNDKKEITGGQMNYLLTNMLQYVNDEIGAIPSDTNIGNSNLTISSTARKLNLSGATSSHYFGVFDSTGVNSIFKVTGDKGIRMDNKVGINTDPSGAASLYVLPKSGDYYGVYLSNLNATVATGILIAKNGSIGYAADVYGSGSIENVVGFNFSSPGNAASNRIGFYARDFGNSSGDNIGMQLDVANGGSGNNIALYVANGKIKLPSGNLGITGTGSYTNFTIENGIITNAS